MTGACVTALMARADACNPETGFGERVAENQRRVFQIAYGVLRNSADAEEVAQEAFTRAYRRFGLLRDRESFRAWLARIAWRLALDRQRADRRRARRELAAAVPLPEPSVEEVAVRAEFEAHLWGAVQELPEKLRVVVILCAMEEHGVGEAARLLRLPEGTVKSRLHLARRALAEKLRWLVSGTTRT